MEEQRLSDTIHGAMFNINIRKIKQLKDFYKDIKHANTTNIKLDVVKENKEVLEWVLENPNYDYNALFDNHYLERYGFTNKELYNYLKVYYNKLLYIMERYDKKEYIIKYSDFE